MCSSDLITGIDRRYGDFISGADIVIHDAQYTASEYAESKIGWGHSSPEYAVRVCKESGVKRLILTHHDPLRHDTAIDRIVGELRARLAEEGSPLQVEAAREGMEIEVRGEPGRLRDRAKTHFLAETAVSISSATRPVALYMMDNGMKSILAEAIGSEGIALHQVGNTEDLMRCVLEDHPSLVMIEHAPPHLDALETARALRRTEGTEKIQVPVVLVTAGNHPASLESGVATDWLVAPFTLSYARTKIRAWALRTAIRWIRAEVPAEEGKPVGGIRELAMLDLPPDEKFDRLTRIASAALGAPISMISLVQGERQWFKSSHGMSVGETARDAVFCAGVAQSGVELIVPDTLHDERFADAAVVTGGPRIRFYAGVPLLQDDGECVGTFCIADTRPRELEEEDLTTLRDLADLALQEIKRSREGEE